MSEPRTCWYCVSANLVDQGGWEICSDCGASTCEPPKLGPPAMVQERIRVEDQYLMGMDKSRGRPRKRRESPKISTPPPA